MKKRASVMRGGSARRCIRKAGAGICCSWAFCVKNGWSAINKGLTMEARTYENINDLYAMLDLLSEGSRANNGTHYVHRGDLQWWLFYTDTPPALWQSRIRLWMEADHLI